MEGRVWVCATEPTPKEQMTLIWNVQSTTACISSQLVSNLPWKSIPLQQILPLPKKLSQQKWSAVAKPKRHWATSTFFLPVLCVQEQCLNVAKVMLQSALNAATTHRKFLNSPRADSWALGRTSLPFSICCSYRCWQHPACPRTREKVSSSY